MCNKNGVDDKNFGEVQNLARECKKVKNDDSCSSHDKMCVIK